MSSKSLILLLLILFLKSGISFAQNETPKNSKHSLEIQWFARTGLQVKQNQKTQTDFGISRTLIVYTYDISKSLRYSLAGDTYVKDREHPLRLSPYLKRAYLQYHKNKFSITAGLLVLEQFKFQRKIWQLRYIDKTFQNKFKYGDNRNIGLLIRHNPSEIFSYDFALTSGYSTPLNDYAENYSLSGGQTFHLPFCSFRLFNRIELKSNPEQVSSLFITKTINKTKIGLELAGKLKYGYPSITEETGASLFLNHRFSKKTMLFARYDINHKQKESPHQESYALTGIELTLIKHTKISLYISSMDFKSCFYGLSIFYNYFTHP